MNWKSEHTISYLTDSREDLSESDVLDVLLDDTILALLF